MPKIWHNALVLKGTITLAFVLYVVVPPEYRDYVALSGNLLWLWKV